MGSFTHTPAPTESEKAAQEAEKRRQRFKQRRAEQVAAIKVTTETGNTFDGDETSQNRMARAIAGMAEGESVTWVLADNAVIQAERAELFEALRLAGDAQAAVWVDDE